MSRYYSVEVCGIIERDVEPNLEVHNWVDSLGFIKVTKTNIKHRLKKPSAKGAQFERSFSEILSLWVSENKDKDVYWRSVGSGGRATRKQLTVHVGDIACFPEKVGIGQWLLDIFVVELKFRDLSVSDVFKKPFDWFVETGQKCQASNINLLPLIIMKDGKFLLTFSHVNVIKDLSDKYFQYGEYFALFDFNIILNSPVNKVRTVWEKHFKVK